MRPVHEKPPRGPTYPDPDAVRSLVMACDQAAKYDDPAKPHFPPGRPRGRPPRSTAYPSPSRYPARTACWCRDRSTPCPNRVSNGDADHSGPVEGRFIRQPTKPYAILSTLFPLCALRALCGESHAEHRYNTPSMCGRYSLIGDHRRTCRTGGSSSTANWLGYAPSYNIAPTAERPRRRGRGAAARWLYALGTHTVLGEGHVHRAAV